MYWRAFLLVVVLVPVSVKAALIPELVPALTLTATPEFPTAGQDVQVKIENFSGSAGSAAYTWTVDGKVVDSGVGRTSITVAAGAFGSSKVVSVSSSDGTVSTTIRPADVDLIWEGNTTVPPFYIGRPVPNGSSLTTILAIPHLITGVGAVSAGSLSYTWRVNGAVKQSLSGFGKSSIKVYSPRFSAPYQVSVLVETADRLFRVERAVTITSVTPFAAFYENTPLGGLRLDRMVQGTFTFDTEEVSFKVFPFFGNVGEIPTYVWKLNDSVINPNSGDPTRAAFRKTSGGSVNSSVGVSFESKDALFNRGNGSFILSY